MEVFGADGQLVTPSQVSASPHSINALPGGAVQVDPGLTAVDPTLAFRDFQLLKLKHDTPLSNFAFNCNLRHYTPV